MDEIDDNKIDDKVFAFVFTNAMRDATLQRAYRGKKTQLQYIENFSNTKEILTEFVRDVIDNKFQNQKEFDERFLAAVKNVCEEINVAGDNHNEFTFGNAQKLINIMMKYFYISTYGKDKSGFRFCHCPMDHQLLKCVWDNKSSLKIELTFTWGKWFVSWSKLELDNGKLPKEYIDFQNAVKELANREKLTPLEYDYKHWNSEESNNSDNANK